MTIKFKVETLSNLYIGGTPQTFEIGGIDMQTVTDYDGQPYIPASSLKGALREVVKDFPSNTKDTITEFYKCYLEEALKEFEEQIKNDPDAEEHKERFEDRIKKVDQCYIFGIEGFNHAPKLIFSDLVLSGADAKNPNKWFSIDMKNSIEENKETKKLESNPRSYKTARKGLTFEGTISFYRPQELGTDAEQIVEQYIKDCLEAFNAGVYRIGNSKSRGYGWVKVTFDSEPGVS